MFLELNGRQFTATEPEVVEAMVALASGLLSEDELAAWLTEHSRASKRRRPG